MNIKVDQNCLAMFETSSMMSEHYNHHEARISCGTFVSVHNNHCIVVCYLYCRHIIINKRQTSVSENSTLKQLLWFFREHRLLTTSYSSPPGANDSVSQCSSILPALCHQPGPIFNPADWGERDEAGNVHLLLKCSSPAPNYFSD